MSTMNIIKAPPEFSENIGYERYKKELRVWQLLKVCKKSEEGPLIFRTLPEYAKAAVIDLDTDVIGAEDGLESILERLNLLYLAEKNQRIFDALDTFENYKRSPSMTMSKFVLEFNKLHGVVSGYGCKYPDGVLAYRLLKAANISHEHAKLIRATIPTGGWSCKSLLDQLHKVFCDVPTTPNPPSSQAIKVEPVYHTITDQQSMLKESIYDDYDSDNCIPYQQEPVYYPKSPYEEYDIYYSPIHDRKYNQWRKPSKQSFYPPQGYQKPKRFIDDPSLRSSLRGTYNRSKTAVNPKDPRGNYTTCRRCRSIYHWVEDCPHVPDDEKLPRQTKTYFGNTVEEEIYVGLFQSNVQSSSDEITCLLGETLDMAVLDSGCPKTVCGQDWLTEYLKSRTDIQSSDIQCLESKVLFRFGDSKPISSIKKVLLPLNIADKDILLETEVVPSKVPLLLSKETMQKAKAHMDYDEDTISLFGVKQAMICTSTGHYAIPIKKPNIYNDVLSNKDENVVLFNLKEDANVKAVAKKLHIQFSHPKSNRLIKLVKDAGVDNSELEDELKILDNKCDTCKRFKKTPPRPVVSLPMSSEFNHTIAMDLKIYENNETYFLHLIDHATRFSAACVIKSKKKEIIIDNLFKHWIGIFGTPHRILSDNGGEFANSEFIDMCENLNINFITTAAEAAWSNGMVEKHNHIIGEAVYKITEDIHCSVEVALCWAINAKNSLKSIYGFSPYQLVFGKNPNLPSVFENKLPALEGVTGSKLIASHLNALHKAREEYIKAEASEKIRRALRAKMRTHSNVTYYNSDEVFYKRDDDNRWRGPGRVIGQDGSKVLIKIPTGMISVHSSRVVLTSDAEDKRNNSDPPSKKDNTEQEKNAEHDHIINDDDDTDITNDQNTNELNESVINYPHDLPDLLAENENLVENGEVNEINNQHDSLNEDPIPNTENEKAKPLTVQDLPKVHTYIQYRTPDSDEWLNGEVTKRGGKVTGIYKFWLNVRDLDTNIESGVDFENGVTEWRPLEHNVLLTSLKDDKFSEAKQKELSNWEKMNVYNEVHDDGQPYITGRWVYTEKVKEGKLERKARLVCRGFEEQSEIQKDSPTCNKDSLRIGISIMSSKNWDMNSLDIKAAFFQGKELTRDVFMKPPKEAKSSGKLWKLRLCVYGLDDGSRNWYFSLKEALEKFHCKCSKLDPAVFTYHQNSELLGILIIHVDDILWSGTEEFVNDVILKIRSTFSISSENRSAFKYIGLHLSQDQTGIHLDQEKYVNELSEIQIPMGRKSSINSDVTEKERDDLRSLIGKLSWVAQQTRPDISFSVSQLGSNIKEAKVKHLLEANKVVRRCKAHNIHMFFPRLDLDQMIIRCYGDASYNKHKDGGSQGGIFIELVSNEKTAPVMWYSRRIRRVVRSTLAAETLAMAEAIEAGQYIAAITSEMLYEGKRTIPVHAVTDNYSLYESAHSTKCSTDLKLRIDLGIIRETIKIDGVKLTWVSSSNQLSDVLTKDGVDPSTILSHITQ